jgi:hypothetical protein
MVIIEKILPIEERKISFERKHKNKDYKIYKEEIENFDKNAMVNIEV